MKKAIYALECQAFGLYLRKEKQRGSFTYSVNKKEARLFTKSKAFEFLNKYFYGRTFKVVDINTDEVVE